MKFFLDTANLQEIKSYLKYGLIDGVTTNPTLIAKEKVPFKERIIEICEAIDKPVSAEVISEDTEGMIKEGREMNMWHKNIYVKLPATPNGIEALNILSNEGIKTNMTLVFSAAQALLVAKCGADLVSPFIGRLDDVGEDGLRLIEEILEMYKHYNFKTQVLVASVRHPRHVVESAKMGAHICTMPPEILKKLFMHPLTDVGVKKFLEDYKNAQ